jgi:glutamate carboxypeptidase
MSFLEDLQALVELQSPSEDLEACRKVISLANEIATKQTGTPAKIFDENGRPIFWWGAEQPSIVVLTHLDTVWPIDSFLPLWQVSRRIEGDEKISGPGIFDMKAGFLQALYAISQIPDASSKVALIATTDEELGSQTSRELIKRVSASADAVLVTEASLNGKVKVGRKGTSMYQIKVTGRAAHAGLEPEKGINASSEIAAIVTSLKALENSELGTTVVPTTMHSGTTTNTVPAIATLDIDSRSFTMAEMDRVEGALRALTPIHPEATIEVTGGINRPPLELTSTASLYATLEKVAKDLGLPEVGSASVGGASDGNFAAAAGAQVLDGLGAVGDGAHAPHEYILTSTTQPRIELLTAFIKELM